jgi:hypothetical protein
MVRLPGSQKLQDKTAPELLIIAHKIAVKRGVRGVPEHAWLIMQSRQKLLLYIRQHHDIYETLGS